VTPPEASADDDVIEVPCLWFFIPLPHPIGLPDKWATESVLDPRDMVRPDAPTTSLVSSVLIHQSNLGPEPFARSAVALTAYAASMMAGIPDAQAGRVGLTAVPDEGLDTVQTIAEVAIPTEGTSAEAVLDALDLALEHVRSIQRAVAIATQTPVRLVARATLPPLIPIYAGALRYPTTDTVEPLLPRTDHAIGLPIPGCAPPGPLGLAPRPFDDEALDRLTQAVSTRRSERFDAYVDLRREAQVQREFDGNLRMTVVALATAGEVLLDTILLHMLWEEHASPEEAASRFDRSVSHTVRMRQHLPPRIGGSWGLSSADAPGRYERDLVRLRHRVVHAGHEPAEAELTLAVQALHDLERYVGDRLAAEPNLKRYPRTAMAWMGQRMLKKRGRWTRFMQTLTQDPHEPIWAVTFARWERHVGRALDPDAPASGSDWTKVLLYAVLEPDGTIRWVLHDSTTLHAAEISDPTEYLDATTVGWATALLAEQAESEDEADHRAALLPRPSSTPVTWKRDDLAFPELEVFPATATAPPGSPKTSPRSSVGEVDSQRQGRS
jgi:hypothetical protein